MPLEKEERNGKLERNKRTVKKSGEQKGAKEKQIEIAKKMLEEKMSIETIAKITELTEEEIKKIK